MNNSTKTLLFESSHCQGHKNGEKEARPEKSLASNRENSCKKYFSN